jgi:ElaB/YqjD/DUF883 family membrane-anchored ribosome-binding protein
MISTPTKSTSDSIRAEAGNLAEAAHGIIAATAEAAEETGVEVRKQLDAVLDRGREVYDRVCETAVDGARAADGIVHEQPYKSLGIALGVGAIIGYLIARR